VHLLTGMPGRVFLKLAYRVDPDLSTSQTRRSSTSRVYSKSAGACSKVPDGTVALKTISASFRQSAGDGSQQS
jgi:hypothetical protein